MDTDGTTGRGARLRVGVLRLVALLFGLQIALVLAAYVQLPSRTLGTALQVYGSPARLPGASAAFRVVAADPSNGAPRRDAALLVEPGTGTTFARAPTMTSDGTMVAHGLGETPALEARADAEDARPVFARVTQEAASWLDATDTYRRAPSQRRPNLSVTAGDAPRVWVETPEETACSWTLIPAANGGVVTVALENRVSIRFSATAGAPQVAVPVRWAREGDGAAGAGSTDRGGVVELRIRPGGSERWVLTFPCDGAETTRTLHVVPSWDGMIVEAAEPMPAAHSAVAMRATHQRAWGEWHQDVWCDGAWVATQTTPIGAPGLYGFPELTLPPPARAQLCLVQGARFRFGPDPPRSVSYFVRRPDGVSIADAVAELAARASEHGASPLSDALGPAALASARSLPRADAERFSRWLLDALPQPFFPMPLLADDTAAAVDAFEHERGREMATLRAVLVVDLVVVALGFLLILVPGIVGQRRRMAEAALEVDSDDRLDGGAGARATLFFACAALAMSIVGIIVLMSVSAR